MVQTFPIPSFADILNQLVTDYAAIATSQGLNVNPDPNSEVYARLYSVAQGNVALYYNAIQVVQANMPDTAVGSDLDRLANNRNIFRKGASQSQGTVTFLASLPQTIVAGAILTGPNSLQYQV